MLCSVCTFWLKNNGGGSIDAAIERNTYNQCGYYCVFAKRQALCQAVTDCLPLFDKHCSNARCKQTLCPDPTLIHRCHFTCATLALLWMYAFKDGSARIH